MHKITRMTILDNYRLGSTYDEGVEGTADVANHAGNGVFAAWDDPAFFSAVRIGSAGELVWGESVDLCPDALYLEVTGTRPKEMFPALNREEVRVV